MAARVVVFFWCVVITGCASVGQAPVVSLDATALRAQQQSRDEALAALGAWEFVGKVHVKGNERPGSAEIRWANRGQLSDITLSGPGGFKASTLQVAPGAVVLRRANGQVIQAENPDELVAKLVGWPMPLSLLSDWVLGLPGDAAVLSRDQNARLNVAQFQEWTGRFSRYKPVDGLELPHRIDITDGHLRVSVRPKRWVLNPTQAMPTGRVPIPGIGG